jgi:endoglucanase
MFLRPGDTRWPDMYSDAENGFREADFLWIRDWGFNFVRLPLCYKIWSDPSKPFAIREQDMEKIDRAVSFGQRYGLHVMLCLHEAPGFCITSRTVPGFDLWKDAAAQDAFVFQWEFLARRYEHIGPEQISFNLVNEPFHCTPGQHHAVMSRTISAIRAISSGRWMAVDGIEVGAVACKELAGPGILHGCRGYHPAEVSHFRSWWVPGEGHMDRDWEAWLAENGSEMEPERYRRLYREGGFTDLAARGHRVVCSELGCYNQTPHDIALRFLGNLLGVLRELDFGFALWNFRGCFGVLDSGRGDVACEDWHGHRLDRRLLELLRAS